MREPIGKRLVGRVGAESGEAAGCTIGPLAFMAIIVILYLLLEAR